MRHIHFRVNMYISVTLVAIGHNEHVIFDRLEFKSKIREYLLPTIQLEMNSTNMR